MIPSPQSEQTHINIYIFTQQEPLHSSQLHLTNIHIVCTCVNHKALGTEAPDLHANCLPRSSTPALYVRPASAGAIRQSGASAGLIRGKRKAKQFLFSNQPHWGQLWSGGSSAVCSCSPNHNDIERLLPRSPSRDQGTRPDGHSTLLCKHGELNDKLIPHKGTGNRHWDLNRAIKVIVWKFKCITK